MIKFRLSAIEENNSDQDIEIVSGEPLSEAIKRCVEPLKITEDLKDLFNVTVNGVLISSEFWDITTLKESDHVVAAPKIKNSEQLGQSLVIIAIALSAAYTGGASLAWWASGLINAGVAIVSSYLVSQLIPPPVLDVATGGTDVKESQVYSITSQANAIRKFGTVPKVYGRHRMFPVVAANPYVELEADPNTGIYSQYMYCIYDFGFGPVKLEDLRIGKTPITEFDQVKYNLVDLNRPIADEGTWDVGVLNNFKIYKGDIASESINTTINGNQNESDPIDEYRAVRNASSNPELVKQEQSINMVCPQGLYGFDSYGNIGFRNIELFVEYAPISTETWKPFNDPATVESFSFVGGGGSQAYTDVQLTWINPDNSNPLLMTRFAQSQTPTPWQQIYSTWPGSPPFYISGKIFTRTLYYGVPTGSTTAILSEQALVGDKIKIGEVVLGTVQSRVFYGTISGINYYTYTFTAPTTFPVTVYTYKETRNEAYLNLVIFTTSYGYELTISNRNSAKKEVLIPGKFQIRAATQEQHFATLKFTPITPGEYKVRITRLSTSSNATTNVSDALTWISLNTRSDRSPINTTKRHTFLEIKIKATGQLNGAIQNLSAIATSVLDTWDGAMWVKQPTRNPAWIYADILTDQVAKKPIDKTRLHIPSLYEWAQHCDEIPPDGGGFTWDAPRYTSDFILDFSTTVQNLLQQISTACQSTPNIIDGKYGVLLDINRVNPVQIFTPRNSWGFASSRNYNNKPHAIRVKFIDPSRDWQPNETLVYDSTFDETTATEFQDLETFGVTNVEQATRYGRFFASQHRLRQETFQIKVDFENLVCTRGDYVVITQDVMKVGGTPARVKTISGNQITIDDSIQVLPVSYGFTFRKSNGQIFTNTLTVDASDTFTLNGPNLPAPGELIVIGEVGKLTYDCIVKQIVPEGDFSATLHLVEKAEDVYDFETVSAIASYDPQLPSASDYDESPPPEVTNLLMVNNYYEITSSGIDYFIDIDWDMPIGSAFEAFEVYVDSGKGYELQTVTKNSFYTYEVDVDNLGIEHRFKVLAVSASGKKLTLGEVGYVFATPIKYTLPPPNVSGFSADISNQTIHFSWTLITGKAVINYMIRYYPATSGGTWETSTIVNTVSATTNLYSTQARLGTYFIKAIDANGKESTTATSVVTTVPSLPNMNFIDSVNDFPGILGSVDKVIKGSGVLILDQSVFGPLGSEQFYAEGFYYFEDFLSLGDIFSVRLTSKIIAEAISYQDLLINWPSLAEVPALVTSGSSDWDVELQYRAISDFIPISDWVTLASIPIIGAGAGEITDWRKFLAGDATGEDFQFRLKLISYNPSITPRVTLAEVIAEMQTRPLNLQGLTAPIGSLVVNYDNAFYGPGSTPNVQISIINGQSGDYWQFISKTLTGFEIAFFDSLNNPVSRQFDASVVGYGKKETTIL